MAISTGTIGLGPTGSPVSYVPPTVTRVPRGSTVSYGEWITIDVGGALPVPAILEVQAGSAPLHAANLALYRTVTITPF